MLRSALLALVATTGFLAFGQQVLTCRTDDPTMLQELWAQHPEERAEAEAAHAELEAHTAQWMQGAPKDGETYVLPVVFHIIHNGGSENISNEQVEDAVRVLNDDFNKLNEDWEFVQAPFLGIVADVGVEFRLARLDPNGNCTNGITRTVSDLTYEGDQDMKDLIQWPRNQYLNIWVCADAAGAAGYTFTPGSVNGSFSAPMDGIVVGHDYCGSIGTSSPSSSRTLTHEVGHWINLQHTWGPSNSPGLASNCNQDDGVSDTPNTIGWTSCNLSGNSCGGGVDNVENYMEYSYCGKMFTEGQKTRMTAALNSSVAQRNQLWQASNLAATGVDAPDVLCAASFSAVQRVVCVGTATTFIDESFNGPISWSWQFPGATPSVSTDEQPVVTYSAPGSYNVTLTVSDGVTELTSVQQNYIQVIANEGEEAPYTEDCEALTSLPSERWIAVNELGGASWEVTNVAGYSGTKSFRIVNTSADAGRKDELMSTSVDLEGASDVTISWRWAYAKRNSGTNDRLELYVSKTCGEYWLLRWDDEDVAEWPTAPNQNSSFVPNGSDQWAFEEIANIPSSYSVENFRFKFVFTSDGGNNLYLDDININGGAFVGVEEQLADEDVLTVLPNPASERAEVLVRSSGGLATVELLDVLGQRLRTLLHGELASGARRLDMDLSGMAPGIYLLRLRQNDQEQVRRFVVR
jgi:PKD repeat protein